MGPDRHFEAPWGISVRVVTLLSTAFTIGLLYVLVTMVLSSSRVLGRTTLFGAILLLSYFGCLVFSIRGYTLSGNTLRIQRLLTVKEIDLHGLEAVEYDPDAMKWSWCIFCNRGIFAITGFLSNQKLGTYKALATDPKRAVVLRFPKKTVVITPDKPEIFIARLQETNDAVGRQ